MFLFHTTINNPSFIAAIQFSLIYFMIYFWAEIKQPKYYFLTSLVIVLLNVILGTLLNLLATGIVWLLGIVVTFIFTKRLNKSIFIPSFAILFYILLNYIMDDLFLYVFRNEENDFLVFFWSSLLYLFLGFYIKKGLHYFQKKTLFNEKIAWIAAFFSALTFLAYFTIIIFERFKGENSAFGRSNSFFIMIYAIIAIAAFFMIMYSFQKDYHIQLKQKELLYHKQYIDDLEANSMEIRRFRHDYQNILLSMEEYIVCGNLEGLKQYFYDEIKQTSINISDNMSQLSLLGSIKTPEIKSLFVNKFILAQENGIRVEIETTETNQVIKEDMLVIIRVLGIILDNAIEAAKEESDGFVRLALFDDDTDLKIIVANSCQPHIPKLHVLQEEGFSTKGKNRGLGLSNLDKLVKSTNHVFLETKIVDDVFIQILTISEPL